MPLAIEESLRIEQPLAAVQRVANADTTVGGVDVAAGCPVAVNIGAANHDPAQWGSDPETFDIFRDRPDRHISFGFGIHRCLGIHLARAELNVLLNRTLDLLPNVRFDPDAAPTAHHRAHVPHADRGPRGLGRLSRKVMASGTGAVDAFGDTRHGREEGAT